MEPWSNKGPLTWHAVLKKDITLVGEKFTAGTMVKLQRDARGLSHIVGYRSAVLQDEEWEMFWNEPAYQDLLREHDV